MDRLSNKLDRLNHFLDSVSPDIVVLSEHGLNNNTISQACINNYSLVSAFSREAHIKGGVAIFKRNNFGAEVVSLNVEDLSEELVCEVTGIKVRTLNKKQLFIIGAYRPPGAAVNNAFDILTSLFDKIPQRNGGICLVGDLNIDSVNNQSREKIDFDNLLTSYDITRLDLPPTRFSATSATSIDVVCTNLDPKSVYVDVLHTGLSDHTGQLTSLNILVPQKIQPTTTRRHLNVRNLTSLQDLLALQSWERVYQEPSAEKAYTEFIGTFTSALNITCPLKTSRTKPKSLNKHKIYAEESRKLFMDAQEKYLRTNKQEDKLDFVQKKKAYDLKLRELKRTANEDHIARTGNKSKAIWDIINSERAPKKQRKDVSWQLNIEGFTVNNIDQVARKFNEFFITTAEETLKLNNNPPIRAANLIIPDRTGCLLTNFQMTDQKEVFKVIQSLKLSSSAGVDEVTSSMVKTCSLQLCHPLSDLINKSLTQGIFPSKLKMSKVYPHHKKSNTSDLQNFRPISLVSTFSKITEKIVLIRLLNHLLTNNLLTDKQHGFLAGRSTITALADLVEHIIDNIEEKNTVTSTFLDLSKAFDCLDHQLVMAKISSLGIKETALKWFKSYLGERKQVVTIQQTINGVTKTATSLPLAITRGVPQGSVLGPVLFILFTCDLPDYINSYCYPVMYADDTVLTTSDKSTELLEINTFISINMAHQYCIENDLVFNKSKTQHVIFGRNKDQVTNPADTQISHSTKHLGLILDDCLSWNIHIDSLCSQLCTALFALRRIKLISTPEATKVAYHALFESRIRYGIILWGASSNNNLQRVMVLQKRAIRVMAGIAPRDSCREAYKDLKILTVTALYILEVILHAHSLNLTRNNRHGRETRHGHNFNLPAHRTALFAKKPSYAGAKLFNALPAHLKQLEESKLKKGLRCWLVEESIYTIGEFLERATEH